MKLPELTPDQLRRLAALAECSPASLRHVAAGRRSMSAEMAIRVERAGKRMRLDLRREDLNSGCGVCEFAKKCRKIA